MRPFHIQKSMENLLWFSQNVRTILKSALRPILWKIYFCRCQTNTKEKGFFMINCLQSQWISWYLIKRWIFCKVFAGASIVWIQLKCWKPFSLKWFEWKWNLIFFSESGLTRTSGEKYDSKPAKLMAWLINIMQSVQNLGHYMECEIFTNEHPPFKQMNKYISWLFSTSSGADFHKKRVKIPLKNRHTQREKPEINHWNHWNASRAEDAIC